MNRFTLMIGLSLALQISQSAGAATQTVVPPPPEVTVMQITPEPARLSIDIVGEIKAYREVELYARVSGNLLEMHFQPGQKVAEGDLLFVIDPGPYQTSLTNAEANLAQALASLARVRQDVERYKPLLPDNAIPRQVFDQTVAQAEQEEAVVASKRAAVERARLDLEYTRIRSPLSGRIGLQKVEVGALVTAGQTPLATVATLDPVAVYFSVSETDYLTYARQRREAAAQGGGARGSELPVELVLADGGVYGLSGRIDYSDPAVNPTTGTLTLRALFDNPDDLLRSGMNSRVRIYYSDLAEAILVPQRAVTETLGRYFITVIGADNRAELRPVQLGVRRGESWLVEQGLGAGERVVVDGVQKARPGQEVTPILLNPGTSGQ
ncbi:MAG TPA: efflux RND transporter periplasmic adaptor subunit [Desulforhopalus sp.]|nr:efflux RND transporter periplasmic adaptor subunit [Desulforhopalus sp.]